ncbi:MAG: RnfABCDGE type electron transport complex subunit D [Acidobacteria bacterium]|nr:RnfABCDGE type electron transport complex subunit D [Acidobacteriota bacterium]
MSSSRRRERRQIALRPSKQAPGPASAPSLRGFATPLALTAGLLALSLVPRVRTNEALTWSFWGATTVLLVWQAVLAWRMQGSAGGRDGCALILARPRAQHYVQSLCQLAVYAYWGWYWSPVYDYAPLLIAQLLFAYAFDILLAWSRRQDFVLGFGPFPIVFSTNLFLWFKDDWFIFQFALVAVGFLGKAFVRWQRDGRRVHIFNPSAFTLALFSLVLLLTDTTHLTWGQEINTTFSLGPRIYTVIFVIGLVVMYFFAITAVTAMAAATLFAASALYVAVTGVPYFVDSEIPSAVFLGLHLLVTDPSTSPRTPLGRAIFGVLYGLGVFTLYAVLEALGLPTFYDKLLCVPLLNLAVPAIDRAVRALGERPILSRVGLDPPLGRANLAHMGAWGMLFAAMTVFGATDGMHRGDSLPFWEQACRDNRTHACERLMRIEDSYCADNAGWACNELGRHYVEGRLVAADLDRALTYFSRACEGRFQAGCVNLLDPERPRQANPRALDLRLLLRESGPNLLDMPEPELYARACRHGWSFACQPRSASR